MSIDSIDDLFLRKLEEQYGGEQRLIGELDEMSRTVSNDRLREHFAEHREESREHVERLESVFDAMGRAPSTRDHRLIEQIANERVELEGEITDDDLLNMVYLDGAMAAERVEMTGYEALMTMARRMDHGDDVRDPLETNYEDERAAYRKLDSMATGSELKTLWERLLP